MLVFGLVRGPDDGWGSPLITGLLIGAVVLMAVFLVAEWRQRDPMLDLTLFKRPAMVGVSLGRLHHRRFDLRPVLVPDALHPGRPRLRTAGRRNPLPAHHHAGLHRGPLRRQADRARSRPATSWAPALLLIAVGCLLMATTHASSGWTVLLPGFIAAGIGIGTVNPVLASSAISVVPPERSGMASGANNTFRQVGIATGHRRTGHGVPDPDPAPHPGRPGQHAGRAGGGVPRWCRPAGRPGRRRRTRGDDLDPVGRGPRRPPRRPTGSGSRPPSTTS